MTKEKDDLSLSKFLKGFFSIRNISKAIVFGLLFLGVQYVAMAVWSNIQPKLSHVVKSRIESNQGTVSSEDSHDNNTTEIKHYHYPLSNIIELIFGAKDTTHNSGGKTQ